jgi:hypothetical protein
MHGGMSACCDFGHCDSVYIQALLFELPRLCCRGVRCWCSAARGLSPQRGAGAGRAWCMHALASTLFTVVAHDSSGIFKMCDASQVFAWSMVSLLLSAAADM